MAIDKYKNHAKDVSSLTEEVWETIPAANKRWVITKFVADCASGNDLDIRLYWDYGGVGQELLFSAHGPMTYDEREERIGDGVKKLAIVLNNQTLNMESMTAILTAYEI